MAMKNAMKQLNEMLLNWAETIYEYRKHNRKTYWY